MQSRQASANAAEQFSMRGLGANARLIGLAGARKELATPALLLDLDALEHNITTMARFGRETGLQLRPHAKTHKSAKIAKMQIEAGALGICVATLREAAEMAAQGISSIHLTTPIIGSTKTADFVALAAALPTITTVVDNMRGLDALEACAKRNCVTLHVLVDVDLGSMYRTGVESSDAAIALAERIGRSDALQFAGVQFYSGIVQHIATMAERREIYVRELDRLSALLRRLDRAGLTPRVVSGGGTGTFHLDAESGLFTENQAGSYVVMDMEYSAVELQPGGAQAFKDALFVQSTVISNNVPGLVTIDAGTKCFATDGPLPSIAGGAPGSSIYQHFGDEFGMVLSEGLAKRVAADQGSASESVSAYDRFHRLFGDFRGNAEQIEVGAKIELHVPHCDPTVNLHNFFHCVRGDTLVDIWPVDARGPL